WATLASSSWSKASFESRETGMRFMAHSSTGAGGRGPTLAARIRCELRPRGSASNLLLRLRLVFRARSARCAVDLPDRSHVIGEVRDAAHHPARADLARDARTAQRFGPAHGLAPERFAQRAPLVLRHH